MDMKEIPKELQAILDSLQPIAKHGKRNGQRQLKRMKEYLVKQWRDDAEWHKNIEQRFGKGSETAHEFCLHFAKEAAAKWQAGKIEFVLNFDF